jgi:hypothetical protein
MQYRRGKDPPGEPTLLLGAHPREAGLHSGFNYSIACIHHESRESPLAYLCLLDQLATVWSSTECTLKELYCADW